MWYKTEILVLTAGNAVGGTNLNAFDNALRDAGIADFNIMKVTSIVPPGIPVTILNQGKRLIKGEGLLVPAVYETLASDDIGIEISAGVGVGLSRNPKKDAGIIFTYSCIGSKEKCENMLKQMISEGMKEKGYKYHSAKIVSATAIVKKPMTSVVASAIFCDDFTLKLFEGKYS